MKELLLSYFIPQVLGVIITIILGIISYMVKSYLTAHKNFLEQQRAALIQKIGIDKYNHEMEVARDLVYSVEQMGREFDWSGTVKHAKATELISSKTGLSPDDIFNVIKSTVNILNWNRPNTVKEEPVNTDTAGNITSGTISAAGIVGTVSNDVSNAPQSTSDGSGATPA